MRYELRISCFVSCFVRVAPVMIHGLNVKKHSCGFDSRTNEAAFTLVENKLMFSQHLTKIVSDVGRFDARV